MDVVTLPLDRLREAPWNPNVMSEAMLEKLSASVMRFGIVENLVVRPTADGANEVLSGNQRLRVYRDLKIDAVPCVVVDLDDAEAMLLAQTLNRLQGEDDLGLKAELVRRVLVDMPHSDVVDVLPETAETLTELASLGQDDMAEHLRAWQQAQAARLKHMMFQLSEEQVEVVTEALERVMAGVTNDGSNPNRRGNALYQLCREYVERSVPS